MLIILLSSLLTPVPAAQRKDEKLPQVMREFRAVWVATVANIDWPSRRDLTVAEQKAELIKIFDRAKELNFNAVVFQVRPQCDALYRSMIEPWSEYLTGKMGQAPEPFYDPLEFAVAEAHARGLLFHAWFNPYRALHPSAKKPAAPNHIYARRPDLAQVYGTHIWLDPGEREVQDYSLSVVLDVVKRYDIDGVHFDDYFYPYPEKDAAGNAIPFPDDASWKKYEAAGGKLNRNDWRRQNVDTFIQRVAQGIKRVKPRVLFGVSPFGIWKPMPELNIKGFNAYEELYADSRKWLREGWVDYFTPQLYWPINQQGQSYPILLDWWAKENIKGRHLWPGNAAYRVSDRHNFPVEEIENQIQSTRSRLKDTGNIFFSMKTFLSDAKGINERLKSNVYAQPAIVPLTPWVAKTKPERPVVSIRQDAGAGKYVLSWSGRGAETVFWWAVYLKEGGAWRTVVLPRGERSLDLTDAVEKTDSSVAVSAVDRLGNESAQAFAKFPVARMKRR